MASHRRPAQQAELAILRWLAGGLTERGKPVCMASMTKRFTSFEQFWPFYLAEHSKPRTRALHYLGTSIVVILAGAALVTGRYALLAAMPLAGYFFAWIAHFAVERNRPATFTYPLWSLIADFRMWWLWLTGRLGPELRKAGIEV